MEERILRNKLEEYQLFILANRYSRGLKSGSKDDDADRKKGEFILKDFFKGMVEDKPIAKKIEILKYIKYHKRDDIKTMLNGERFGIWQYGENFFMWTDRVIDDIVDSLQDEAERVGGSSVVGVSDSDAQGLGGGSSVDSKEESKGLSQEDSTETKKRGRSVKSFSDCIVVENKTALLAKLHKVLDGRKGRDVYLVLNTLLYMGVLLKYTYTQAKNEFGDIGSDSLKTKYSGTKDGKISCISAFETGEIEGVKKIFSEFLK